MVHNPLIIRNIENKRLHKIEFDIVIIAQNNATTDHVKPIRIHILNDHIKIFTRFINDALESFCRVKKEVIKRETNGLYLIFGEHWREKIF